MLRRRSPRVGFFACAGAALVALALGLSGCSSFSLDDLNPFAGERYKQSIDPDVPASQVYDQGLGALANGAPQEAAKKFTDLGKKFPSSDWARKGLIMSTYANYTAGDYDTASEQAKRYVKEYPNTPEAAYAKYLEASSYYAQVLDISRDQERAYKAMTAFAEVVKNYPKSEYVDDAKFKVQVTMDQLAGKEMSIGRFYLQRRNYTAAINRFRSVLANYQTTRHAEEALYRLVEAYLGLGITDEAETAGAILGHNYPDGQWYKDAYALLKGGGLEPHENQDSWISKLYHSIVPS
jgi:outer membrane protein assembly factor BamD